MLGNMNSSLTSSLPRVNGNRPVYERIYNVIYSTLYRKAVMILWLRWTCEYELGCLMNFPADGHFGLMGG